MQFRTIQIFILNSDRRTLFLIILNINEMIQNDFTSHVTVRVESVFLITENPILLLIILSEYSTIYNNNIMLFLLLTVKIYYYRIME